MNGTSLAIGTLIFLGAILVVLGLFAGNANLPVMAMGLVAVIAAGALGVAQGRR